MVLLLVGLGYAGEVDLDLNWRKSNVKGLILIYWHKKHCFLKSGGHVPDVLLFLSDCVSLWLQSNFLELTLSS